MPKPLTFEASVSSLPGDSQPIRNPRSQGSTPHCSKGAEYLISTSQIYNNPQHLPCHSARDSGDFALKPTRLVLKRLYTVFKVTISHKNKSVWAREQTTCMLILVYQLKRLSIAIFWDQTVAKPRCMFEFQTNCKKLRQAT